MKPILKSKAAKLLETKGREALLFEKPPGGKLKINEVDVKYAYLNKDQVVLAKGEDGRYYSDLGEVVSLEPETRSTKRKRKVEVLGQQRKFKKPRRRKNKG
jgi:hypothetical protein